MHENNQYNLVLKKRLNTFRTAKGALVGVPDELIIDVIKAWEQWTGTPKTFYQSLGIKREQLAFIIKKGKRIYKENKEKIGPFIPVEVKQPATASENKVPIILNWDKKKTIRFYEVSHLVEFLKKAS